MQRNGGCRRPPVQSRAPRPLTYVKRHGGLRADFPLRREFLLTKAPAFAYPAKAFYAPTAYAGSGREKYHAALRYKGRPSGRSKLIETILLVKGLQFDHAIVLDADSLSTKKLYVALTREAKSLSIISVFPDC